MRVPGSNAVLSIAGNPARKSTTGHRARLLAVLAGAAIAFLMVLAAGTNPWHWWRELRPWQGSAPMTLAPAAPSPDVISVIQPEPTGTDSSVSTEPARLVLQSIRPGRNSGEGTVALGVNAQSPQVYAAGALLANGARIVEIHGDHIVLERDGEQARLYAEGRQPAATPLSASPLLAVGGRLVREPARVTSEDELSKHIRVSPAYRGDRLEAIEVFPSEASNAFALMGLKPGDRVTAINGQTFSDAAKSIAALRGLAAGEALQVTVVRSGVLQSLALDGLILREAP